MNISVSMENIMNVIDTHRSKPISWSVISGPLPKGSYVKGLEEMDTHSSTMAEEQKLLIPLDKMESREDIKIMKITIGLLRIRDEEPYG